MVATKKTAAGQIRTTPRTTSTGGMMMPAFSRRQQALAALAILVLFTIGCGCGSPFGGSAPATQVPRVEQPANSRVRIGEIVTAGAIGANNTPSNVTQTFSQDTSIIYVVAEIEAIPAGTSVFARWSRGGQPFEDTNTITADRDYSNTFLEFHIQPRAGTTLPAGQYSVTLYVNGNPYDSVDFTVR
jgi:hypothetical protein